MRRDDYLDDCEGDGFQSYPEQPEGYSMNLSLSDLTQVASGTHAWVYYYIVKTTYFESGRIMQKGTGPNIEGGWITLCTCKHSMRSQIAAKHGMDSV
jgi:hypothetical protein